MQPVSDRRPTAPLRATRIATTSFALLVGSVVPSRALADGSLACVQAAEKGQDARDRGALRAARAHFVQCAADACPRPMRVDCAHWLEQVDSSLPSIVVGAKDASGVDLFDVRVKVDSEPVDDMVSGRPIVLDPGPHVVRFERGKAPDVEVREVKVLLRTGERNRAVLATMQGASDAALRAPKGESAGGVPTATWIFGGIGLLALGSFGTFAILGGQEKSRLRDTCSPGCTAQDVATLRGDYLVADISLGVGIVAIGLATYFLLANAPRPADQRLARTIWK